MATSSESGTNVQEIADGIYRISTPVQMPAGSFTFNQFLVDDDEPLLFHTGLRKLFPVVRDAVASVIPVSSLRHLAFSHVEADECGSLNQWLAAAPGARPVCGQIAAMVSVEDLADRPPSALQDSETLIIGRHTLQWFDAPHLPHAWECGFLLEKETKTLFCGDLFTQGGDGLPALTESDILESSEAFRQQMDYFSHTSKAGELLEKLAGTEPATMACMHGSCWRGDGAMLLRALGERLIQSSE
jgi:flavorubredoxin